MARIETIACEAMQHGRTIQLCNGCVSNYPKHVAGRAFGVVVHKDVAGVEAKRRNLTALISTKAQTPSIQ